MSTSTLQKRLGALEAAAGGDGGCPRCVGSLIIIGNAISGELHSASWNGEPITGEELRERQVPSERKCSRCGKRIDPDETLAIKIGGHR